MKKDNSFQVIDGSYRRGVIFKCALIFTAGAILTAVILYFSTHQPVGPSYREGFKMLTQLRQEMLTRSIIIYAAVFILVLTGITAITLLYSHRVVGPMARLSHMFKGIAAGDLSEKVVLRKKDVIRPLAAELNLLIDKYRQVVSSLQKKADELEKYSSTPPEAPPAPPGELEKLTKKIAGAANELKVIVENMKL